MGRTRFRKCCLCKTSDRDEIKYGQFLYKKNIGAHYYCLLLSSSLKQRGNDDEGFCGFLLPDIKKEMDRIKNIICSYCHEPSANIYCCRSKCHQVFHLKCGINNGCMNIFNNTFQSFCRRHATYEKRYKTKLAADEICSICYDTVGPFAKHLTFRSPCCKTAWFHRFCLAKFAVSAGYFFKCPRCNNSEIFRNYFSRRSIFIPDRDAAWELDPNAFEDLLERPETCVAAICNSKFGRDHTNSAEYDFLICEICGSNAIHKACMIERSSKFNCDDCKMILEKPDEQTSLSTNLSVVRNNTISAIEYNNEEVDVVSLNQKKSNGDENKSGIDTNNKEYEGDMTNAEDIEKNSSNEEEQKSEYATEEIDLEEDCNSYLNAELKKSIADHLFGKNSLDKIEDQNELNLISNDNDDFNKDDDDSRIKRKRKLSCGEQSLVLSPKRRTLTDNKSFHEKLNLSFGSSCYTLTTISSSTSNTSSSPFSEIAIEDYNNEENNKRNRLRERSQSTFIDNRNIHSQQHSSNVLTEIGHLRRNRRRAISNESCINSSFQDSGLLSDGISLSNETINGKPRPFVVVKQFSNAPRKYESEILKYNFKARRSNITFSSFL